MPVSSSSSLGMPGGSWTIEEESTIRYPAPQSSSLGEGSSQQSLASIQGPYTVIRDHLPIMNAAGRSFCWTLPTFLKEVRLLSPTSSASRDTWRVRISPEYDIEVNQGRSSLCFSCLERQSVSTPSLLDIEWDFPQGDDFPSVLDISTTGEGDDASLHGIPHPRSVSTLGLGLGTDFLYLSSVEDPARAETESTASSSPLPEEESSFDDDRSTIHSSHSVAVTSISIPSTARPSPSPPRSNIVDDRLMQTPSIQAVTAVVADHTTPRAYPPSSFAPATASIFSDAGSGDDSKSEAQGEALRPRGDVAVALAGQQLWDAERVGDRPASDLVTRGFLGSRWRSSRTDNYRLLQTAILVVAGPEEQSISQRGVRLGESTDFGEETVGIAGDENEGPSDGVSEPAAVAHQRRERILIRQRLCLSHGLSRRIWGMAARRTSGDKNSHPSASVPEPPRIGEPTGLENGAAPIASDEHQGAVSTDGQSDDGWLQPTPELPARAEMQQLPPMHFPSPSLTDEVLSSPEFHALVFRDDFEVVQQQQQANPRRRRDTAPGPASHVRAFSPVERRSIFHFAPCRLEGEGKGKSRERARTISGDSGFAESATGSQRLGRKVQTETETDKLKAKCVRLKKELRVERAKVEGLVQREAAAEHWIAKWFSIWGVPTDIEQVTIHHSSKIDSKRDITGSTAAFTALSKAAASLKAPTNAASGSTSVRDGARASVRVQLLERRRERGAPQRRGRTVPNPTE
ncbi:hypothetical protein B0H14DRAFT_3167120 [Mycena olivaceomarginata]|nr:hypothetical protein B0H14DRAFT_3167120 [Mycena olivaceomarginata]